MKLKDICTQLNVEYNPKRSDRILKDLQRKYVITRNGRYDYTLVREYTDDEKFFIENSDNCKELLKSMILLNLNTSSNTIVGDLKSLLSEFGLVNNNYKYFTYDELTADKVKLLNQYYGNTDDNIIMHQFVVDAHPILNRIMKEALHSLEDEKFISIHKTLMIQPYTEKAHIASETEEEQMLFYSRKHMDEINVKSWSALNYYQRIDINKKVCKDMGIKYTYYLYEIVLNRVSIEQTRDKILNEIYVNKASYNKLLSSNQGQLKTYTEELKRKCLDFLIDKS